MVMVAVGWVGIKDQEMMKKYFATRSMSVDGRTYNQGDIVWSEIDVPGLQRADGYETAKEIQKRRRVPQNKLFGSAEPMISVVVTFHNQAEFVRDCIGGFQRQTIGEPYELVAVIDKSDENEAEILKKEYPQVRVFEADFGNADKARNYGRTKIKGDYIAWWDGDDYPFSEYLEKLKNRMDETGADFAYARFEHQLYGLEKGKLPRCNVFEWSESWVRFSPITNTPILIKRRVAPIWNEDIDIMQDTAYGLELMHQGLTGVHVREVLWHYRHHQKSVWNAAGIKEKRAKSEQVLRDQYGWRQDEAEVTFVSLISRDEVLDEYFGQIPHLGLPKKAHWFILVDNNEEWFIDKVKGYQKQYSGQFLSSRMFVTGQKNEADSRDFEVRGMRIANFIRVIINQANERIGGTPYLFMVEDDTLVPKNAYKRLTPLINRTKQTAYASGIECGRGYTRHTGICWLKKDDKGEIIGREIPKMKKRGIEKIGGAGWYCWIGRVDYLKDFIDHNTMRCFDGKMLGPDVMMAHDLTEMGYDCFADLSVQCQHYDSRRRIWLDAMEGKGYDIDYYLEGGKWKMKLNEKV